MIQEHQFTKEELTSSKSLVHCDRYDSITFLTCKWFIPSLEPPSWKTIYHSPDFQFNDAVICFILKPTMNKDKNTVIQELSVKYSERKVNGNTANVIDWRGFIITKKFEPKIFSKRSCYQKLATPWNDAYLQANDSIILVFELFIQEKTYPRIVDKIVPKIRFTQKELTTSTSSHINNLMIAPESITCKCTFSLNDARSSNHFNFPFSFHSIYGLSEWKVHIQSDFKNHKDTIKIKLSAPKEVSIYFWHVWILSQNLTSIYADCKHEDNNYNTWIMEERSYQDSLQHNGFITLVINLIVVFDAKGRVAVASQESESSSDNTFCTCQEDY